MDTIRLSVIADILLWSTIPLLGVLAYWEQHIPVPATGHELLQLILLGVSFSWAYFWFAVGERDRLAHFLSNHSQDKRIHYINLRIEDRDNSSSFTGNTSYVEIAESIHASEN